jgi:hypothetical protein
MGVQALEVSRRPRSADPHVELGDAVLAEAGEPWCPDARCGAALNGSEAA